jgi:hypothetical protein
MAIKQENLVVFINSWNCWSTLLQSRDHSYWFMFFFFFIIEKTYVALQKVLLICTIITLYKIYTIFYFCFIPSQTKLMPVPTHVLFSFFPLIWSVFLAFSFSSFLLFFVFPITVYIFAYLFIFLVFFSFVTWFKLVVNQECVFSHILKYFSSP